MVLVLAGAAALLVTARASPHFDGGDRYTHRGCPAVAGNRIDPINVVFHGWGTWGRAVDQIEAHAGWRDDSGSTQSFADHDACYAMHAQRASGHGTRFHVRLRGQHPDPELGWAAAASAHHEDFVTWPWPCGHAVDSNGAGGSGFDQGRDELGERFAAAGHAVSRVW